MSQLRIYNDAGNTTSWRNLKRRLERLPDRVDRLVGKLASESRRNVVRATPKKWTGQTRRGWVMYKLGQSHYVVKNDNPVMRFLEYGTKAHGPVTANRLFIPLRRVAFNAYLTGNFSKIKYGRDYVLAKRVRGIRAKHIARDEQREANKLLVSRIDRMVQDTIY
jgi:hypothetical protein